MTTQEALAAAQQQVRDFLTETGIAERLSSEQLGRINAAIDAAANVVETNGFQDAAVGTEAGDILITDRSNGDISGNGGSDLFLERDFDSSTQEGGAGDDIFFGGTGFVNNEGGAGDDFALTDGTGNISFDGDEGNDELAVFVDEAIGVLVRALRSGPDTFFQLFTNDGLQSFLNAVSVRNTETIGLSTGDQADDIDLSGVGRGEGNFTIDAGGASDIIVGSINSDTVRGGAGDDTLSGGSRSGEFGDQLFGEAGNDIVNVTSNNGNTFFNGGTGQDTVNIEGTDFSDNFVLDFDGTRISSNRSNSFGQAVETENVEGFSLTTDSGNDAIEVVGVDGEGQFDGASGTDVTNFIVDVEGFGGHVGNDAADDAADGNGDGDLSEDLLTTFLRAQADFKVSVNDAPNRDPDIFGSDVNVQVNIRELAAEDDDEEQNDDDDNVGDGIEEISSGVFEFDNFEEINLRKRFREEREADAAQNLEDLKDALNALALFADAIDPFDNQEPLVDLIRDLLKDFGSIFEVDPGVLSVALPQVNLVIDAARDVADQFIENDLSVSAEAAQEPGFIETVQEVVAAVDFLLIGENIRLGFLSSNQFNKVEDITESLDSLLSGAFTVGAIPDDIFAKLGATLVTAGDRVSKFKIPSSADVIAEEEVALLGEQNVSADDVGVVVDRLEVIVNATLPVEPDTVQQVVDAAGRIINDSDRSLAERQEAFAELKRLKDVLGVDLSEIGAGVNIDEQSLLEVIADGLGSLDEFDLLFNVAKFAAGGQSGQIPQELAQALVDSAIDDFADQDLADSVAFQTGLSSIGDGSPEALSEGRDALEQLLQPENLGNLSAEALLGALAGFQRIADSGGEDFNAEFARSFAESVNEALAVLEPSESSILQDESATFSSAFAVVLAEDPNLAFIEVDRLDVERQTAEVDGFEDLQDALNEIQALEEKSGQVEDELRDDLVGRITDFAVDGAFAPGDAIRLLFLFEETISPLKITLQDVAIELLKGAFVLREQNEDGTQQILQVGGEFLSLERDLSDDGTVVFENGELIDNRADLLETVDGLIERLDELQENPSTTAENLASAAGFEAELNAIRQQIERGSAGNPESFPNLSPEEREKREAFQQQLAEEQAAKDAKKINISTQSTTETGEQRDVNFDLDVIDRAEGEFKVEDFNIRFDTGLENVRFDVNVGDTVEIDFFDEDGNQIGDFDVDAETTKVDFSGAENAAEVAFTSDDGSVGVLSEDGTQVTFDNGVVFDIADLDIVGDAAPVVDGDDNNGDAVNLAPNAEDDVFAINEDAALGEGANLFNDNGNGEDNDPDGDPISIVEVRDADGEAFAIGEARTLDDGGTLTVFADGRVAFDPADAFQRLAAEETEEIQFSYTISDGEGGADTAEARILVAGLNDAPEAANDIAAAAEDTAVTTGNVLSNDADIDGDQLRIVQFDAVSALGSTVTDNGDGTFGYLYGGADLAPGEVVVDTFTYTVSDGALEDTATVSVTVTGSEDEVLDLVLRGSNRDDELTGDAGADRLFGRGGSDTLVGRAGDDRLVGDAGADTMQGGSGDDTLLGGRGNDNLRGGDDDDRLFGGGSDDVLRGDAGNDHLSGQRGNDNLRGGGNDDRLFGGGGDDVLRGDAGNDRLSGQQGNDNLRGGGDDDRLFGGGGDDRLLGDSGDDELFGGSGADRLIGQSGADLLNGDGGADVLSGGAGRDVFQFGEGFGSDRIQDFAVNDDLIDFTGIDGLNTIADVEILGRPNGTLIRVQGEGEVLLTGVDAAMLEDTNFLF